MLDADCIQPVYPVPRKVCARRGPSAESWLCASILKERTPVKSNPVLDFGIDKKSLQYIGADLHRPECILAEPDGSLWAADARGGVTKISPNGDQQIVTQTQSEHFDSAGDEATRFLTGTLPNGLAFAKNGDILISNFGTDRLSS